MQDAGCRMQDAGYKMQDTGYRVHPIIREIQLIREIRDKKKAG